MLPVVVAAAPCCPGSFAALDGAGGAAVFAAFGAFAVPGWTSVAELQAEVAASGFVGAGGAGAGLADFELPNRSPKKPPIPPPLLDFAAATGAGAVAAAMVAFGASLSS